MNLKITNELRTKSSSLNCDFCDFNDLNDWLRRRVNPLVRKPQSKIVNQKSKIPACVSQLLTLSS
jgi:hypothetical protein